MRQMLGVREHAKNPPPLSEADLRPGRYADHAFFYRIGAVAIWLLLGISAGLAGLCLWRQGRPCQSAW
jgi:hypothetical protein